MIKFLEKHFRGIVIVLLLFVFGIQIVSGIIQTVYPETTAVIRVVIREAVKEEIQPLTASIASLETKIDVLYYNAADEWVRLIDKQYVKLQSNASNLYWMDVEYVIGKWSQMPEDYKTPSLITVMEYIQMRYEDHIIQGGD